MYKIYKEFHFDAAHFLPNTPDTHKCHRLHGHTYHVTLYLTAEELDETGWVVDFGEIKRFFKPIEERLDHNLLNDIPGLENPTSEVLAKWIYDQLKVDLPQISEVKVQETTSAGCSYIPSK